MSENHKRAEEKALVDRLCQDAQLAVDNFVINHRDELLGEVTAAARSALTTRAAIAFLVGNGLIREGEDPPEWLPLDIPEHLKPDIEAAKAEYRRYNELAARR